MSTRGRRERVQSSRLPEVIGARGGVLRDARNGYASCASTDNRLAGEGPLCNTISEPTAGPLLLRRPAAVGAVAAAGSPRARPIDRGPTARSALAAAPPPAG